MKFNTVKKEFLDFLEFDKGYSERTIENYDRDISKFEVYITEFSINYKKLSKENGLLKMQVNSFKQARTGMHISHNDIVHISRSFVLP